MSDLGMSLNPISEFLQPLYLVTMGPDQTSNKRITHKFKLKTRRQTGSKHIKKSLKTTKTCKKK